MSLESTVAALSAACTALLALPQQITSLALAKIADIGAAYTARIAALSIVRYVNGETGNDANSGLTADSPYKTIQKALADAPRGALVRVILQRDIILTAHVFVDGRDVRIESDSETAKRGITPERYTYADENGATARGLYGFRFSNGGRLMLRDMRLNMPAVGTFSANPNSGQGSIFTIGSFTTATLHSVTLHLCEVNIPASPFGPVFRNNPWAILVSGLTAVDQAIAGRFHAAYTNTAGTATSGCPDLVTNLATI